jgi:hypothetical protein
MNRLVPFESTVCPKCLHAEARVTWCDPTHRALQQTTVAQPNGDFDMRATACLTPGEHLHRTCARCGYAWLEACADAPSWPARPFVAPED